MLSKSLLLFAMNWLDGQLTLLWIRLNIAEEGNALMARVLTHGELPFMTVKVLVGGFAAYVLYRCSHLPLAKRSMTVVLGVYTGLMVLHAATGCAALGWHGPARCIGYLVQLPRTVLSLFS